MSPITFEIKSFAFNLDFINTAVFGGITIQIEGYINCYGENGNQLIIYGLNPLSPIPAAPVCIMPSAVGAIFVPAEQLKICAEHLKKDQQIFACLDPNNPEQTGLMIQKGGYAYITC